MGKRQRSGAEKREARKNSWELGHMKKKLKKMKKKQKKMFKKSKKSRSRRAASSTPQQLQLFFELRGTRGEKSGDRRGGSSQWGQGANHRWASSWASLLRQEQWLRRRHQRMEGGRKQQVAEQPSVEIPRLAEQWRKQLADQPQHRQLQHRRRRQLQHLLERGQRQHRWHMEQRRRGRR